MTELEISVTDAQLREVTIAAVASALTTEKRDALLRQAIEQLLNKSDRGYGKTNLQSLFESCVREHVENEINRQLRVEPYKSKLAAATADALDRLLVANMDRVTDEAAKQIGYAIRKGFEYND